MQNSMNPTVKGTLLSCFAICIAVLLVTSPAMADVKYVLGSGDKVRITVYADLTGEFEVDGSGVVACPLIGEVGAAGGTARQLEKSIASKLSDGYLKNPTVNVEVLTYRPFFIMGEVKRPGSYPYKNGLTLLSAVALAGGYTYRAKSDIWIVTRDNKELTGGEITRGDFRILPGDTIVVPERFF